VCLRVTKGMPEVDTVFGEGSTRFREGPRGVRILGAEKASVIEVRRIAIG